jgi:anti-anti-sigma factor
MGGPQVIDRAGEIAVVVDPDDLHAGYELLRCVYELADAEDSRPVVVDLTGCRLVDAAMLRAIGHAVRHLRARGRTLLVDSPPPQAVRALHLSGLDRLVTLRGQVRTR